MEKLCRYRHEPGQLASAAHAHRDLERQFAQSPDSPRVEEFLAYADVDVLCLQETKLSDSAFPQLQFSTLGYESVHHGQGQWNGVAILSRVGIEDATWTFGDGFEDPYAGDARLLLATCGGIQCASVYVPNGRSVGTEFYERKLVWLGVLRDWLAARGSPDDPLIVLGDFNVAPEDRDVWDPKAFVGATHVTEPERAAVRALDATGAWKTRSGACIPTPIVCTRTGTTARATSINTGACASISRSRRGPSPNGSRGPSSIATPARAPVRPTTRR